jgi:hypothetical protein
MSRSLVKRIVGWVVLSMGAGLGGVVLRDIITHGWLWSPAAPAGVLSAGPSMMILLMIVSNVVAGCLLLTDARRD